jgi:hypothetical protein
MIIHDFYVPGIAVTPSETDSPLIVDANAVSARPIAFQAFQAVSGRTPKVVNRNGRIHGMQFRLGPLLNRSWQAFNGKPHKNGGCPFIGKAPDHGRSVPYSGT